MKKSVIILFMASLIASSPVLSENPAPSAFKTYTLATQELTTSLQMPASNLTRTPWGLISDTAFTLRGGQFNISALGWITYGLMDKAQVGTNYLADIFQIVNLYWKYNFLDEGEYYPAVSIGAIHYSGPLKINNIGSGTDWSINLTKQINPNLSLYGGGSRFSTTSLLVNFIRGMATQRFIGRVGLIMYNSPEWRSYVESGFAVSSATYNDLSFGVEWSSKALPCNVKLGLYFPFVPIIDLYWRF